ncbi:hypothetical protein ACFDR9_004210 [Janthinobacterium sp. CG_23.3]|uniref:hypothetical protein n=1 Tax=unclassified Janthinobacterium TaxID=2610881 RepID=UPI002E03D231|nr:hypothetical protein [Janthinobacterium sp. CG_S6]
MSDTSNDFSSLCLGILKIRGLDLYCSETHNVIQTGFGAHTPILSQHDARAIARHGRANRGVLGRMADAADDAPVMVTNYDQQFILRPSVGRRQRRHKRWMGIFSATRLPAPPQPSFSSRTLMWSSAHLAEGIRQLGCEWVHLDLSGSLFGQARYNAIDVDVNGS